MDIQEAKHSLTGPVMSMRTPFSADGLIDYGGVRNIIDASIAGGSRTVMLTVGDSHYDYLTDDEIAELTRFTCQYTAGRAMVIAADRYHTTARATEFARFAKGVGADMYMALPPDWGGSCTPTTLAEHYAAVAEIMPLMIVTNIFIRRGISFGLETLQRAFDLSPNIVAVKDDMCGTFAHDLCMRFRDRAAIIAGGQKRNHMNMWPYGCDGYLSTMVTFNPSVSQAYWNAIESRDITAASAIITEKDAPLFDYLTSRVQGGFDAGIRAMLEIYNLAPRHRRKPYYTLNDQETQQLKAFLKETGLFE